MGQQPCRLETGITKRADLDYLLYLPETYGESPDKRWPLVSFLHGMEERGADLELVKKHGIPKMVEGGKAFPFVAVSSQCPADSMWVIEMDALRALMDEIVGTHAVDPSRVYLTGLSMGDMGPGTGRQPTREALPQWRPSAAVGIPTWATRKGCARYRTCPCGTFTKRGILSSPSRNPRKWRMP